MHLISIANANVTYPLIDAMRYLFNYSRMLLVVFHFFSPAVAKDVTSGAAQIIDGDTIHIEGQRVRLYGIDAAEINQFSQRKGVQWPCGINASEKLKELAPNLLFRAQISIETDIVVL